MAFFLDLIAASVLFAMMVLTCVDVVGRYFFSRPVLGATELTEIGLALVIFSAMPIISWRGGHIVVDLIDGFVSPWLLKVFTWVSTIVVVSSFYFVAFRIYELGARDLKRGIKTDFLHIPTGLVVQSIAVLSWITAMGLLITMVLKTISSSQPEETEQ